MISKEKLTEIVQKSVEDAWYNRRSVNPVKEQTEIITNAIWEQLNKPDVSKSDGIEREISVCDCKHSHYHIEEMAVVVCTDCGELLGKQTDC